MPDITRSGAEDHDDGSSSSYDPEYELEEVVVNRRIRLRVLTVVPPPVEFLAALRACGREISGRKVWTGSLLLAQYLCHHRELSSPRRARDMLDAKRILELGSGTGLLGMALSKVALEASCVVLSDGDVKAVDLLRENLLHNGIGSGSGDDDPSVVMAEHLVWGDDENGGDGKDGSTDRFSDRCRSLLDNCWRAEDEVKFDCIVAGDVLYKGDLPGLFFQTVQRFLSQGGTVWLCHVPRANVTHEIVVAAAQASGLEVVERVRASDDETAGFVGEDCPRDEVDKAQIYRMTRSSPD